MTPDHIDWAAVDLAADLDELDRIGRALDLVGGELL